MEWTEEAAETMDGLVESFRKAVCVFSETRAKGHDWLGCSMDPYVQKKDVVEGTRKFVESYGSWTEIESFISWMKSGADL